MMTTEQAQQIAMVISQNEGRDHRELTDSQISMYLVDSGLEESAENIQQIRNS